MTDQMDADAARVLQQFADIRSENVTLRAQNARLEADLSIERARLDQLDRSYREMRAERDNLMRSNVELRTQLTNAATMLTGAVERVQAITQQGQLKIMEQHVAVVLTGAQNESLPPEARPLPRVVAQGPRPNE